MTNAYACRISQENLGAIASEKPDFDREEALEWIQTGGGFFIRDEGSPFDCEYMADVVFHQIYLFDNFDRTAIFHRILRM